MTGHRPGFLPPPVVLVEARHDAADDTAWPEELAVVAASSPGRRAEYVTVRHCARRALSDLGYPPAAILDDAKGAPVWPAGVIGSLTHCRGYRAAAVARQADLAVLGLDAEPAAALPAGVLRRISTDREFQSMADLTSAETSLPWDRLLFSAKESVYKAWYPLVRLGLGFHEVEIALHPNGRGELVFLRPVPSAVGRLDWQLGWDVADAVITTVVWAVVQGNAD